MLKYLKLNALTKKFNMIFLLLFFTLTIVITSKKYDESTSLISINNLIFTKNDMLFVSTKDGSLHAYTKSKGTLYPLWKANLGEELLSMNIISEKKVTNDVLLLPLEDKLYLYQNGEFTSMGVFIKDLVDKSPQAYNDYLLIGNKKSTLYIINVSDGEVIHSSLVEEGFDQKLLTQNVITVIRVDYILTCLYGKEKFWNATYSDIVIQRGKTLDNIPYLPNKDEVIKELIGEVEIDEKEIMTVHSFDKKIKLPVKIFERSRDIARFEKDFEDRNEEKSNIKYNQKIEDNITKFSRTKKGILTKIFNNFGHFCFSLFTFSWFTGILTALVVMSILKKIESALSVTKKAEENSQCFDLVKKKDFVTLFYQEYKKNFLEKSLIVKAIKNHYHRNSIKSNEKLEANQDSNLNEKENVVPNHGNFRCRYSQALPSEISESGNEIKHCKTDISEDFEMENPRRKSLTKEMVVFDPNANLPATESPKAKEAAEYISEIEKLTGIINVPSSELKKLQRSREDQVAVNSYEGEDTVTFEVNHKTKVVYKKTEETNQLHRKLTELNASNNANERRNSTPENEHQELSGSSWLKSSRKYTGDEPPTNIMFYDDSKSSSYEDEEKKVENKKAEKSQISTSLKYQTRLDKDFKDFVRIGKGGFGLVLKAKHKIDEEVYAIKIINLTNLSEQNVITEAKTMTKIRSKHIVEYKTCWFEKSLGSAINFLTPSEQSSFNMTNTQNLGNEEESSKLPEIEEDSHSGNSIVFEDEVSMKNKVPGTSKKNLKSKTQINLLQMEDNANSQYEEYNKLFNDPVSDDEKESNKRISKRNPVFDFRDDSNIITSKRSRLSRKNHLFSSEPLYFFIQMEYCAGLPLDQYITSHENIDRKTIYTFTYQILKSLNKIHQRGIIHRDIKPANIFVDEENGIKIGDFGLATDSSSVNNNDIVGTPLYLSPEQMYHLSYDEKVDVYASGVVLYEMCACFGTLMERRESINALRNDRVVIDKVKEKYPNETQLILWMTESKPNNRPNAIQVITSQAFKIWKEDIGA